MLNHKFLQKQSAPVIIMFFFLRLFLVSKFEQQREKGQSSLFFTQTGIPLSFFPLPRVLEEGLEPHSANRGKTFKHTRTQKKHTAPTHPLTSPLCVSHWDILFRASSVVFARADGTHYLCMLSAPSIFVVFIFRPISTGACVFSPQLFLPSNIQRPTQSKIKVLARGSLMLNGTFDYFLSSLNLSRVPVFFLYCQRTTWYYFNQVDVLGNVFHTACG